MANVHETWLPVPKYEGYYECSNLGQIRNVKNGRIKILSPHAMGYIRVVLSKSRNNKNFLVHRIVAKTFLPNPENKPFVNHKDGNKKNNNIENLEWVTRHENETHAKTIGLKPSGQRNGGSKISDRKAEYIRKMYAIVSSKTMFSKYIGLSLTQCNRIYKGKSRSNASL